MPRCDSSYRSSRGNNRARSFVFTTGLAPAAVAAAGAALDVIATEPERRAALVRNAEHLRAGLRALG